MTVIDRLESPTGASLAVRHWQAKGTPRAVLIICHGLGEHSGRYARVAAVMATRGFATIAHDHRGHGLTTAPDALPGRFSWRGGADKVIADVLAVRDEAERRYPGLPVFLFGHSMGGLIALNVAMTAPERFAGIAPWNMNAVPGRFLIGLARFILKSERARKGSDVPADLLPRLTIQAWNAGIKGQRTDADWLSHDPAEVDAFLADPLCGRPASVSLWIDLFDLITGWRKREAYGRAKELPFFLLGGGEDPATECGAAIDRLAKQLHKSGFTSVRFSIYRYTRHDTFHDRGKEDAVRELVGWCEGRLNNA